MASLRILFISHCMAVVIKKQQTNDDFSVGLTNFSDIAQKSDAAHFTQ